MTVIQPGIDTYFGLFDQLYFIPMMFGIGSGLLIGLFMFGLLGGLISILLYKRRILRLPNYKISAFVGYLLFILIFFILPMLFEYSYHWPLVYLPFLHIIVILIFLAIFDKKKVCNSLYWSFILSYFIASFVLGFFPLFWVSIL